MPSSRNTALLTLLVVAAAAVAVLVPFLIFGNASGHDFEFHLASWMDVVHQWHQRVLYPRWAELANYGYGEPRFVFYPPISWMLGAALSLLFPWPMVPGAFYWTAMVLAGLCMFRLAREWLPGSDAGFAALLYAVNPYHLLHIYWRSDFAELLASAIFPLIVLYAIRAGHADRRALPPLSLLFAATWLMNAPAAVVASYSIALLLAVTAVEKRSLRGVWIGAAALVLGFALAAFYIVPAAFEQRWVTISEALSSGLRPSDNYLFTWTNDPEHTYFNFRVSKIAVAEMLIAAVAGFAARRLRERREVWWALVALLAAAGVLMLRITRPAWALLPELRFVQFPWRWLLAFNAVLAVVLASAVAGRRRALLWAACIAALALCAFFQARDAWWDSDGVRDLQKAILVRGKGYEGTDEYTLKGGDHYDLDAKAPPVTVQPDAEGNSAAAQIQVERWRGQRKLFAVHAQQPVTLALRLMNYPAWRVTVNGRPAQARSREAVGQMVLDVPAGASRVEVTFGRTPDRFWGGAISMVAAAAWLLVGFLQWRSPGPPLT